MPKVLITIDCDEALASLISTATISISVDGSGEGSKESPHHNGTAPGGTKNLSDGKLTGEDKKKREPKAKVHKKEGKVKSAATTKTNASTDTKAEEVDGQEMDPDTESVEADPLTEEIVDKKKRKRKPKNDPIE